ncbi:MAG: aspartyl/asparaginyl beta-hydroxylase domain-containing protein, partial [Sphingomicrobium sp.]
LLDRGDELAFGDDRRGAVQFYNSALVAAQSTSLTDAATIERLRQAQSFIQRHARDFQAALDRALDGRRGANAAEEVRMIHALEMLEGKREIALQHPSVLYYPYLAQRQFWERDEFEWVAEIEAATLEIREELLALLESDAEFRPYVEDEPNRPRRQFAQLNDDPSWSALYLFRDGRIIEDHAGRCPTTMAALAKVPLSAIGQRTPVVLFSRLEPGAHIPPHHGMLNCRIICHLPLIVPSGCTLRVGNETRTWEQGKLLMFDDSLEHEAHNPSGELRIILLFDVWRPELGQAERDAISAIFNAIDDFQPLPDA